MKASRFLAAAAALLLAFSLVSCASGPAEDVSQTSSVPSSGAEASGSGTDEDASGTPETSGDVFRYLAVGNSITRHEICDYWWNEVGMAASTADKDYFHLVTAGLEETYGAVEGEAYNFSVWEITDTDRAQTIQLLDLKLNEDLDLVTVQLSENLPSLTTFESDFEYLIQHIREKAPNARILILDDFWYQNRGYIKAVVAARSGITFVSLAEIRGNTDYQCGLGTVVYDADGGEHIVEHAGVAGHPGDSGMQYIADAILAALATEPPAPDPDAALASETGPTVDPEQNILTNPGFEEDDTSWIVFGDTPIVTTNDPVHSGERALSLTGGVKYTQWIPVSVGDSYTIGAWVYGRATLISAQFGADASISYITIAEGGTDGAWTWLEGVLTIQESNTTQVDVTFTPIEGSTVYVDDVFMAPNN